MFYFIVLVALAVLGYILYTRSQSKQEAGVVVDQTESAPYKVESPTVTVEEIAQKAEVVPAPVAKQPKTSKAKPTAKSKTTAKSGTKPGAKTTAKKPAGRKTAK